ncbi:isoleucine--tRNA ligase-like [Ylistrum balloti]|uniref:isoleucine--tRNA ligase-like n=1 Tax=Ylistrum balloti TaxID=509963 RepID=UPI002905E09C|nr:isoleucine--tRNA ligase-like [Ylistrum balloti]
MFEKINNQVEFPKIEEEILEFWKKENVFEQSKNIREKNKTYVFYDGPPFATGLPHYGHILASTIKDIVPRYFAMKGNYVERRFGWDCHGLPVEMEIQKELGFSTSKEIIEYGVDRFNDACRKIVLRYAEEWEKVISRMGRWVDFKNDYKTMNISFMESVWWVFKSLYDKGLIYRGFKVMPYSWKAETILSNFEENLNYKETQDHAITVKLPLVEDDKTFFLAWTTTPWTLISNLALAVGGDLEYAKVKRGDEIYYLSDASLIRLFKKEEVTVIEKLKGRDLIGIEYQPLFNFASKEIKDHKNAFRVLDGKDYVSEEEGVGIVQMAPAYGVEDFEICSQAGLPCFDPIDNAGFFNSKIDFIAGMNFKEAEKKIIQKLKSQGKLFKHESIHHSYPFCWRTDTPLMYKAISTWFVKVTDFRDSIISNNQKIHWEPKHIKNGRFGKWLENVHDWAISRNRFWGTPLPIWESENGDILCFGDIASLEKASGKKVTDLHKEYMDVIVIEKEGKKYRRIPEVLDCWFESGSMPYGQNHYPFENKEAFDKNFPAHFISEGLDQTRGWFYTLLVISSALFDKPSFQNVMVSGLILAEDGKKMSKRLKNYPDPSYVLSNYGADALRVYLISSSVIKAETLKFSENGLKEIVKSIMIPLWNVFSFLTTYANIDGWDQNSHFEVEELHHPLDRWLFSYRQTLIEKINLSMENYQLFNAVPPMIDFIEKLTNTYVRRSRKRFWKSENDEDKNQAYFTLYENLKSFAVILAPFMPFVSERIYQVLRREKDPISVHLEDYPTYRVIQVDKELEKEMEWVDKILSMARALRLKNRLKIRQPLKKMIIVNKNHAWLKEILNQNLTTIKEEINVKEISFEFNEIDYVEYQAKIDFQKLGKKFGSKIKTINNKVTSLSNEEIIHIHEKGNFSFDLDGETITLELADLDIRRQEKQGHVVFNQGELTCVLDVELNQDLIDEGYAREFINRVQKKRKEMDLNYTDRIKVFFHSSKVLKNAIEKKSDTIEKETLANELCFVNDNEDDWLKDAEQDELNEEQCLIKITKIRLLLK